MTFNDNLVRCAEAIAARKGGFWEDHILAARKEVEAHHPPLQKLAKRSPNAALRKRAVLTQLRHHMPGIGSPDPDRATEIGECETELGRVRVAISRDSIAIHGVNAPLSDIDADLRGAVVTSAASFAAAETDIEQTEQRAIIGVLMDAIVRRHKFLTAAVTEAKRRERYDV